jgi:hypothetical protein
LQFKCDLEKENTLSKFAVASKVNTWEYGEIMQHNRNNVKGTL